MDQPDRQQTYGERAVGASFNPSNDERVTQIKQKYAEIIDLLDSERRCDSGSETEQEASERKRLLSIALTEAQGAQMWAVKAVTWGK